MKVLVIGGAGYISKKDENLNVIKGDVISFDTTSSYIRGGKRTIATIGLDNVVRVHSFQLSRG